MLIKTAILSKYRKLQATKPDIISFLVSCMDLQTWDGARVCCVVACHGPQLGSVVNTQARLGLPAHLSVEGLARCRGTELGLPVWDSLWLAGCAGYRVTSSC